jgi:hypothetical protein
VVAVISVAAIAAAQDNPLVRDHPGTWQTVPPITPRLPDGLTAAERTAITASTNQLLETHPGAVRADRPVGRCERG